MPGLLDFSARHYQPTRGVFLQPDTVVPDYGNPQSLNRYAFELNSPVGHTDPSGHIALGLTEGAVLYLGTLVFVSAAVLAQGDVGVGDALNQGRLAANEAVWEFLDTVKGWFASEGEQGQGESLGDDFEKALDEIDSGKDRPNVRDSKEFENDGRGGSHTVPKVDSEGNPIGYDEHTVNPRQPGQALDGKRIVTGSDDSVWVTSDHARTPWRRIR